jgi:tripartite-type tricarboxylate transporter receptor subunit TctC
MPMEAPITLSRRDALVLALAAAAAPTAAGADTYPSRPVTMVAPSGAGGLIDVYTRAIADELRKALHENFLVKDESGAGTTIGTNLVAKAAPDGYTLLMVSDTQAVSETLYANRPYQLLRDLTVVAPLMQADLVLVVNPAVPATNIQEFLALARDRPGRINFGSVGLGSSSHMAGELLKQITGIDILHMGDKDSSDMLSTILLGHTQVLFDAIPTVAPLIASGKLRALATTGEKRSPVLPDVPTFAEAGVDFQTSLWVGCMAPKATPAPVIDLLNRTIVGILNRQDIRDAWRKQDATPMLMSRDEFTAFVQREIDKWALVIKANHMPLIE